MTLNEAFEELKQLPFDARIDVAVRDLSIMRDNLKELNQAELAGIMDGIIRDLKEVLDITYAIQASVAGNTPAPTAG